ncbi:MAG: hypothetical protein ACRESN_13525, partial [Pseudomonas sp.]|jgi:hypothetical protein
MPPRIPASADASNAKEKLGLSEHLASLFGSAALLVALLTLLRVALLLFNRELIGATAWTSLAEAFFNGLRFDLRLGILRSSQHRPSDLC